MASSSTRRRSSPRSMSSAGSAMTSAAAYEDKIGRRGIRVCDLFDRAGLEQEIRENVQARNRLIKESTLDWRPLFDQMLSCGERMKAWVTDVSVFLAKTSAAGKPILF